MTAPAFDRRDTVPADSLVPPPTFAPLGAPWAERRAAGVWHWDRDALLASGALSLLELLERVPSVLTLRAGMFLQPEVASAFGGTDRSWAAGRRRHGSRGEPVGRRQPATTDPQSGASRRKPDG